MPVDARPDPLDDAPGCGACSLCCKVLVVSATDSPAGQWCRHCSPQGRCGIYDMRPAMCRAFECGWLASQRGTGQRLPAELRPDRCHGVLMPMGDGRVLTVHVDPSHPDAWRTGALGPYLERVSQVAPVTAVIGRHYKSMDGGFTTSWSRED